MLNSLSINAETHLLEPVVFKPSPHHDERPQIPIDTIVIHNISLPPGQFGTNDIEEFFLGKLNCKSHPFFSEIEKMRVSSHLLIKRNGSIMQFVPFIKRAWHAGVSTFCGKSQCNDFSIGIELEGTDTLAYEAAQYANLVQVIKLLMQQYPKISADRIVGHEHIAPGRKTDPGPAFDWDHLRNCLKEC